MRPGHIVGMLGALFGGDPVLTLPEKQGERPKGRYHRQGTPPEVVAKLKAEAEAKRARRAGIRKARYE